MNKIFLSVGIIPFFMEGEDEDNEQNPHISEEVNVDDLYFLMIQRKDTIGYTEFIRGKYNSLEELKLLIDMMTLTEKRKILSQNFYNLWHSMWYEKYYTNQVEFKKANDKFDLFRANLEGLVNSSKTRWLTPEWGFPKGRKNKNENNIDCAIREMKEETNIDSNDYNIIRNIKCLEEITMGTNQSKYIHKYFLAKLSKHSLNSIYSCILTSSQKKEISNIGLFNYNECLSMIRDYETGKKQVLVKVFSILKQTLQFKLKSRFYTNHGNREDIRIR